MLKNVLAVLEFCQVLTGQALLDPDKFLPVALPSLVIPGRNFVTSDLRRLDYPVKLHRPVNLC